MEVLMQGYNIDGSPHDGPYHGRPHARNAACDGFPKCRPIGVDDGISAPAPTSVAPAHDYRPPPGHYSTGAGIDPWAVWDAFDLDRYTANAVKYLLRAGKKDIAPRLDDLKKARDYINKAIEREEQK